VPSENDARVVARDKAEAVSLLAHGVRVGKESRQAGFGESEFAQERRNGADLHINLLGAHVRRETSYAAARPRPGAGVYAGEMTMWRSGS
jgi:hypothetical protein